MSALSPSGPTPVLVPTVALRLSDWNPRSISEAALESLCHSMTTDSGFMWARPILAREDGEIYAGHQRYRAALRLGWATVPAIVENVSDVVAKERALRDNNQWGTWEDDGLSALLAGLKDAGAQVEYLGFEDDDLARLLAGPSSGGGTDPGPDLENAAALQAKWGTARGQVWQVGRHRLGCIDSTNKDDVARLLGPSTPGLMVTDPPYGVEYDPAWRQEAAERGQLAYAARRTGDVQNDDRIDWQAAWALFPGDVVYVWHAGVFTSLVQASLELAGFEMRSQIIWAKPHFPISRGHYHWRHEPCWYAVRKGRPGSWAGDRKQTTLVEYALGQTRAAAEVLAVLEAAASESYAVDPGVIARLQLWIQAADEYEAAAETTVWPIALDANVRGGHGTQKPVECMARPIRNHATQAVYDPFLGSGTTMVAAEQLGRVCHGAEIDPGYAAVVLERLTGMGLEAKLV